MLEVAMIIMLCLADDSDCPARLASPEFKLPFFGHRAGPMRAEKPFT
jgi:hypothetical protein